MPTTVDLQKMFKFSPWPLTIVALALAVFTLILIAMFVFSGVRNKKAGRKNTIKSLLWTPTDLEKLRQEYLAKLMQIEFDFDSDKQIRSAYERMSVLIREFTYKATGVEVLKYSLSEIKGTGLSNLADLIEEYYEPEFDKISEGDVKASIEKTRKVISEWN
jgi:hypothetical protein